MDEKEITEKFELAKKIAESFDEKYKMEGFKVVFEYLLQGGFSKSSQTRSSDAGKQEEEEETSDELQAKIKKLADRCKINVDELEDVVKIENGNVELILPLSGKESEQQILGSQIILLVYEFVLDTEWLSGTILKDVLRKANITDKSRNFAQYLKLSSDLFRSSSAKKNMKYTLTSNKGRESAMKLLRKLAKGEKLDES